MIPVQLPQQWICDVCMQDEFELHDNDKAVIAAGVPRHWRLRYKQLNTGAFQGLHVSPV